MPGLPVLPPLGPYSVFYLLAVLTGGLLAWRQAVRHRLPVREWLAVVALAVATGVAGSRLLHFDPAAAAGAKTVLGGVLAGVLALLLGVRLLRLDPRAPDSLAPVLPLSLALGRVGCLLAGCCFGEPLHAPWAVVYDVHSPAYAAQLEAGLISASALQSLPVHPTQLYDILVALLALALLPRLRRVLLAPGSLALATLAVMASGRIVVEFLRPRALAPVFGLDRVQWLLVALTVVAILALLVRERSLRPGRGSASAATVRSGPRLAVVLAVPPLLLVLGSGSFAAIESAALVLLSVPAMLAILRWAGSRVRARRFAPAAAFALLLPLSLQEVALPPGDSSGRELQTPYPRSFWTLGLSATTSNDHEERGVYRGEGECGPIYDYYPFEVRDRLVGLTAAHTRARSAERATTIRLRGFLGRSDADPSAGGPLPADSRNLAGAGMDLRFDRRWFGITAGAAAGQFHEGEDSSNAAGVFALRVGPLSSIHGFVGVNDLDPLGTPRQDVRMGLGVRLAESGTTLRGGVWREDRFFLHATLVAGQWEIEPFTTLGNEFEGRLAIRRRLAPRIDTPAPVGVNQGR